MRRALGLSNDADGLCLDALVASRTNTADAATQCPREEAGETLGDRLEAVRQKYVGLKAKRADERAAADAAAAAAEAARAAGEGRDAAAATARAFAEADARSLHSRHARPGGRLSDKRLTRVFVYSSPLDPFFLLFILGVDCWRAAWSGGRSSGAFVDGDASCLTTRAKLV